MPPFCCFIILHWCISWSWPESFHDTKQPPVQSSELYLYWQDALCGFGFFFYFCIKHTDLFTSGNTAMTTLCYRQQMSSALYLTDFVSASISWLLGVQVLLVLPTKRFALVLCLVSCFTLGPMVGCRTPSPTSFFCLKRTQVHFQMYYLTDSCDHRWRGNQVVHYNVHHCSSALQSCQ